MALNKEEFIGKVKEYIGDRDDDETISFLEYINDSVNNIDEDIWKEKYEENDAAWRKKYKERFFAGTSDNDDDFIIEPKKPKQYRYEDLFTMN